MKQKINKNWPLTKAKKECCDGICGIDQLDGKCIVLKCKCHKLENIDTGIGFLGLKKQKEILNKFLKTKTDIEIEEQKRINKEYNEKADRIAESRFPNERIGQGINVWLNYREFIHECCGCGLKHDVKMRVVKGKPEIMFKPLKPSLPK